MSTSYQAEAQRGARAVSRFQGFANLTAHEFDALRALGGPHRTFKRGEAIRSNDDPVTSLHLLLDGWAASAIAMRDGGRQFVTLNLPGDVLGMPSLALAEPLDDIVALSPVTVCAVRLSGLTSLFTEEPRLAAILFVISQEERIVAMERLALAGRVKAKTRLAALLIRLSERVTQTSEGLRLRFDFPLQQRDLADLIGVTPVHMSGLVKELHTAGVIKLTRDELQILDYEGLAQLAEVPAWRRTRPQWLPPASQ